MAQKRMKSATDQRPFTMIYHDFLESDLLTTHEKMVFIALKKFADSKDQCFPSLRKLADITRMSKRKIQDTLKTLEQKHIIGIESRSRADGGNTSNLYTLYDFKELWNAGSNENMEAVTDEIDERRMIETLTAKGYYISKEKGLVSGSDQTTDTSTTISNLLNEDTTNGEKSQAERYTMEDIKTLFDYSILMTEHPEYETDVNVVFDILYETLNTGKTTVRISGGDRPSMVVIGKLMKLEPADLVYAIMKFHEQTGRIKNVKSYLLAILYNAKEQRHLDMMNLGHHNGDF